jgi:hypothetical protein
MPASASWSLIPELSTSQTVSTIAPSEHGSRVPEENFLGFGLLRPFQRDLRSDFAAAGGERLIRSAVGQILGTMGST